ncbi:MAG: hypothetical protein KA802_16680 [Saprospiraceae bacterium]|nr:hypothetical protein [Saprospiraceae bacterium]
MSGIPESEQGRANTTKSHWVFTLNNYTEDEEKALKTAIETHRFDYLVYGYETAPTTGTPHLQGYIYARNKISFKQIKNIIPRADIRFSIVKKDPAKACYEYCTATGKWANKNGNGQPNKFIELGNIPQQGKRSDLEVFMEDIDNTKGRMNPLDIMRAHPQVTAKYPQWAKKYQALVRLEEYTPPPITLTVWQERVLEILNTYPEPRRIIWIWSPESKTGKTTFMKHVAGLFKSSYLTTDDLDKKNILYAYDSHKIIHIALARDMTPAQIQYLTSTIEGLSDQGIQMSSKYESINKLVEAHIVVTSNQPPPSEALPGRFLEFKVYPFDSDKSHDFIDHIKRFDLAPQTKPLVDLILPQKRQSELEQELERVKKIVRLNNQL